MARQLIRGHRNYRQQAARLTEALRQNIQDREEVERLRRINARLKQAGTILMLVGDEIPWVECCEEMEGAQ